MEKGKYWPSWLTCQAESFEDCYTAKEGKKKKNKTAAVRERNDEWQEYNSQGPCWAPEPSLGSKATKSSW